jgi:hypothetical protein
MHAPCNAPQVQACMMHIDLLQVSTAAHALQCIDGTVTAASF